MLPPDVFKSTIRTPNAVPSSSFQGVARTLAKNLELVTLPTYVPWSQLLRRPAHPRPLAA